MARNGPGDRQADRAGDGDGIPGPPRTERGGQRARQGALPVLAVGGHVDHRLAGTEPGHPDEQRQAEQRHHRDGDLADGQVRPGHQEPQRGPRARGLPPVTGGQRLDQPGEHHRRHDDDERGQPGEHPDDRAAPPGRPVRRLHGIPRGVVGAGQDGTEAVTDRHPDQCARQPPDLSEPRRHPDKTKPESRQRRADGRAGSSREVCGRWMGLAGARPSASEGVRMGASAHHPAADRGGDHGGRQRRRSQAESPCMISRIRSAVSDGVLPTLTPAASRASFLACAVPDEPDTMAPAWPIVLPSGAVNPAT